jgi:hypothetical protein
MEVEGCGVILSRNSRETLLEKMRFFFFMVLEIELRALHISQT